MSKPKENELKKQDYEILFKDSPEYFCILNAKMFCEGTMLRFICFDDNNQYKSTEWYPLVNIHRVKAYN